MREAAQALNLKVARTAITLRQAYADAPGQRKLIFEMSYAARDASEEMEQLFRELQPEAVSRNVLAFSKKVVTGVEL